MMGVNKKLKEQQELEGIKESVNTMDRISQLPQHIIHDILCFLPTKDAARTSILSKTWLCAWSSFPNFDFDENYFKANESPHYSDEDKFMNFIHDNLQRCLEQDLSVNKFRLCLSLRLLEYNEASHIDRWVRFAIERNVKELDLTLDYCRNNYSLPEAVLHAKTINVLKLHGCFMKPYSDIKLSHLQELSLERVKVDEEILENLISRCPLIKDLRLKHCALKYLKVLSHPRLNRVQVESCVDMKKIEIEASSLQTFHYNGFSYYKLCEITLKACEILREVTLTAISMKDQQLQDFISKLPSIEVLVLNHWQNSGSIKISSQKLKRLVLRSVNVAVTGIDAPNLISLEYVYNKMPFYSLHCPNLQEIEVIFRGDYGLWHHGFNEFLRKFNNSKGLTLAFQFSENVIVHEDSRGIRLPPVENFEIYYATIKITSRNFSRLLEELTRGVIKTLSIVSHSNSKFLKILYAKPEYLFRSYCMHVSLEKVESFNGDQATNPVAKALIKFYEKMKYKTTTFRVRYKENEGLIGH